MEQVRRVTVLCSAQADFITSATREGFAWYKQSAAAHVHHCVGQGGRLAALLAVLVAY